MKWVASLLLAMVLAGKATALAQSALDPNEGARLQWDAANSIWRFLWWGRTGRTYFIQQSEDLVLWNWLPVIESDNDSPNEWRVTSTADRFFLRLVHTDIPTTDPANDD